MSRAFAAAFDLIKMNHFNATYGAALFDALLMKALDDGVLRKNIQDYMHMSLGELADLPPEEKEYAFSLLQEHLAAQPKATEDPEGETPAPEDAMPEPMQKAFRALLDAHFLRKNVVGIQDNIQYNLPPSVASMAQRPQVPEMQRGGFFGRQRPTGETVVGGPTTMNLQSNAPNPMAGVGTGMNGSGIGEMMPPPGASIERMPHPSPFSGQSVPPSFASQGYQNVEGQLVPPSNPFSIQSFRSDWDDQIARPMGERGELSGTRSATQSEAQAGDQFNRQTRQF